MTTNHLTAATVLVAIDISKHHHEVLIAILSKTRRRRRMIVNTLEGFQCLSSAYRVPVATGRAAFTGGCAGTGLLEADANLEKWPVAVLSSEPPDNGQRAASMKSAANDNRHRITHLEQAAITQQPQSIFLIRVIGCGL